MPLTCTPHRHVPTLHRSSDNGYPALSPQLLLNHQKPPAKILPVCGSGSVSFLAPESLSQGLPLFGLTVGRAYSLNAWVRPCTVVVEVMCTTLLTAPRAVGSLLPRGLAAHLCPIHSAKTGEAAGSSWRFYGRYVAFYAQWVVLIDLSCEATLPVLPPGYQYTGGTRSFLQFAACKGARSRCCVLSCAVYLLCRLMSFGHGVAALEFA